MKKPLGPGDRRFTPRGAFPIVGAAIKPPALWGFDQGATPGTGKITLDVYFMDWGFDAERDLARRAAESWRQGALGDRLEFRFNQGFWSNPADFPIRVHFHDGDTSTSEIGTDALKAPADKPTMMLSRLSSAPDAREIAEALGAYTHEFGHVLGLHHEHQGSNGTLSWNEEKIQSDLAHEGIDWSLDDIRNNLTMSYPKSACPTETGYHGFDADSIMIYPLDPNWTQQHFGSHRNLRISRRDRACMAYVYDPRHNARIKSRGVAS